MGTVMVKQQHALDATRECGESSQLFSSPVRRDCRLSVDIEALWGAKVAYITEKVVAMGHPATQLTVDDRIMPNRHPAAQSMPMDIEALRDMNTMEKIPYSQFIAA